MRVLRALLLLAALASAASAAEPRWERMTFPGEEFSAEWPAEPFVYEARRKVKNTKRDYEKLLYFGAYAGGVVFRLTSFHRPRAHEKLGDFLAELRQRDLYAGDGTEVTAGGLKGVAFAFGGPLAGEARVFRTPNHVYVIEAMSQGARAEAAARFLDSLAVGPNPQGRAIPAPAYVAELAPEGEAGGPPPGAFSAREVERKAVIVLKLEPPYTELARRNNVRGMVRLRAVLSSEGKVTHVRVVKGLPDGLTAEAVRAAHCIQFFPAEQGGRPVSQWVTLEYNFNIY